MDGAFRGELKDYMVESTGTDGGTPFGYPALRSALAILHGFADWTIALREGARTIYAVDPGRSGLGPWRRAPESERRTILQCLGIE